MSIMMQIDYVKYVGVDWKMVSCWIKVGKYIVFDGDLVNVEESDKVMVILCDSKDFCIKNVSKNKFVKVIVVDIDDNINMVVKEIMLVNGVEWI